MPNAYQIIYDNVAGDEVRVDIVQDGETIGSSTVIEAGGRVTLEVDDVDDPFEPIRTTTATIELDASASQDFSELFSETEREWYVNLYRDSSLIFRGWLQPDGIFEDYVRDNWVITLTAICGLSGLANKAFVDSSGNFYEDKDALRDIVIKCLNRTGFSLNVAFVQSDSGEDKFPVRAETVSAPVDYFDLTVDQRAFLGSDGNTADSCEDVLRNILTAANAFVYQYGAIWYVDWVLQPANPNGIFTYKRYDSTGTQGTDIVTSSSATIGSEINGSAIHWVNENQRIERRPSLGKMRVNYRYNELAAVNTNPELDNNGSTITGWTNIGGTLNSGGTVTIISGGTFTSQLTSAATPSDFDRGSVLKLVVSGTSTDTEITALLRIRIELSDGVTTYYLGDNGGVDAIEWTTSTTQSGADTHIGIGVNGLPGSFQAEVESPVLPITGDIVVKVYPLGLTVGSDSVDFDYIGVLNTEVSKPQGASYDGERIASPSSYTYSADVIIGDYQVSRYLGTLFLDDGTTDTDVGFRTEVQIASPELYETTVRDRMFARSSPARVFEGDVFGWFNNKARKITIDGFTGAVWVPVAWSWDSFNNTISVRLWELFWTEDDSPGVNPVLDDIQVDKIINYGNVVEPTIKG